MPEAFVIAINGAESTGKTQLAQALAAQIALLTDVRCTAVPEQLRAWCDAQGRTPRVDEQMAIALMQEQAIAAAAQANDIVVCDTTPLMTTVYSRLLFNDDGIDAVALRVQRRCDVHLLTALDIAWVSDGLQRDGPHVRLPVDDLLRDWLMRHRFAWSVIAGQGAARLQHALDAVMPRLAAHREGETKAAGLFTRLQAQDAAAQRGQWQCDCADVGACEHRLMQARQRACA